ncbi:NYN domain-containing protein [Glaciihabitans sp. UYNi722]|uniref:NYN domain-containing protein n=1 Tax=Glaciihabitans sp. UYNi722 TaxID=3156344 RepID=UPI003391C781
MADTADNRVAVYIDFDNIVISRYNQLHGAKKFTTDRARNFDSRSEGPIGTRITDATVDIGAILDFASSFGSIVISRAYADWSATVNASYQKQLIDRAVDLTQLFTTTQQMKNGADIRLAVDVVEDLFRLDDITHVVIVAGDSDYIALAQRCKRLGRYVVGIGVAGSTSKSLAAACDEFADYDALPGISDAAQVAAVDEEESAPSRPERKTTITRPATTTAPGSKNAPTRLSPRAATSLLRRALTLGLAKTDSDWMQSSEVKTQMRRMDPAFNESALGFTSFTEFVKSRNSLVELDEGGPSSSRRIRLRQSGTAAS